LLKRIHDSEQIKTKTETVLRKFYRLNKYIVKFDLLNIIVISKYEKSKHLRGSSPCEEHQEVNELC